MQGRPFGFFQRLVESRVREGGVFKNRRRWGTRISSEAPRAPGRSLHFGRSGLMQGSGVSSQSKPLGLTEY